MNMYFRRRRLLTCLCVALLCAVLFAAAALADDPENGGGSPDDIIGTGTVMLSDGSGSCVWTLYGNGVLYFDGADFEWDCDIPDDIISQASTIRFSKAVMDMDVANFYYKSNLVRYEVDEDNPKYAGINGFLCSKDGTEFLRCPPGQEGTVTVPDGVKIIGFDAFYECDGVTEVLLPDSVVELQQQSFFNCDGMTSLAIPVNTSDINIYAFSGQLSAFTVDERNETFAAVDGVLLTKTPYAVYLYPGQKTGAYIAPEVEEVGQNAFRNCRNLTSVTFPEGLSVIRSEAFQQSSLSEIHLPSTLSKIESEAFGGCTNLTEVYFSGTRAQWAKVSIDNGNVPLQFNAVHCSDGDFPAQAVSGKIGQYGQDVSYTLTPEGDLTISGAGRWESNAFWDNDKVRHAMLRSGVTEVGWSAFQYCDNLESILIPETVTEIRMYAFYQCTSLKCVTIPASVTEMGGEVFERCSSLRDIYFGGTMEEWNNMVSVEDNSGLLLCTVHCSDGDIPPTYQNMGYGLEALSDTVSLISSWPVYILAGSGAVPENSVYSWQGPQIVEVWEGITSIGAGSMSYVSTLTTVYLPVSLQAIEADVFDKCDLLERVYYAGTREQWSRVSVSEDVEPRLEGVLVCTDDPEYKRITAPAFNRTELTIEGFVGAPDGDAFTAALGDDVWMTNYVELYGKLNGEPEWTLEQVDGEELDLCVVNDHPYEAWFGFTDGHLPDHAAQATYRAVCDWDGSTAEITLHFDLRAFDMGFPQGINVPDVIDAEEGVNAYIDASILPAGWTQDGVEPQWELTSPFECWEQDSGSTATHRWAVLPDGLGEYELTVILRLGNITLTKAITLNVTEEGGDPDELDFCSWNGRDRATYVLGVDDDLETMEDDVLQINPFVTQYWLNDHDNVRDRIDGDPVFECSVAGSARFSIEPHPSWEQPSIDVYLLEMPESPEVDTLHLSCEWGEFSWEQDYEVEFVAGSPDSLPTGIDTSFEEPLTFMAGEEFRPAGMAVFSDGWQNEEDDFYEVTLGYSYGDYEDTCEWDYVRWDGELHCAYYTLEEPGEYSAVITLTSGKLVWRHVFPVRVADENGNIPVASIYVDRDYDTYYLGIPAAVFADGNSGMYSDDVLGRYGINNYERVKRSLGDQITWRLDQLEGTAKAEIEAWDDGFGGIVLRKAPDAPETDVFRVVLSRGEETIDEADIEIAFEALPEGVGLPAGIEADDAMLRAQVDVPFDYEYVNQVRFAGGWSLEDELTRRLCVDEYLPEWTEEGWLFDEAGCYATCVEMRYNNLVGYRNLLLVVTDDEGVLPADQYDLEAQRTLTLPENLHTINESAFEGIAGDDILEVHIPSGVDHIDDHAFDGCNRVFCFTQSEYVKQYCLDHGIVPVME